MTDNFIEDLNSSNLLGKFYSLVNTKVISMGIKIEKVFHENANSIYFSRLNKLLISEIEESTSVINEVREAGFDFLGKEGDAFIIFNHCNYKVILKMTESEVEKMTDGYAVFLNFEDKPYIFSHTWLYKRYKENLEQVMNLGKEDEATICETQNFKI